MICGEPVAEARKTGVDRGPCTRVPGHSGGHSTREACIVCGVHMTPENTIPSVANGSLRQARCRNCVCDNSMQQRINSGGKKQNVQEPGWLHEFPCGCAGFLPDRGGVNKFVAPQTDGKFRCRVSNILRASNKAAKRYGHVPIPRNTSHALIRKMMDEQNCVLCGGTLEWVLGPGKTPHLHHDHTTGEIYGFAHPKCNPRALQIEVVRLKKILQQCYKQAA